VRLADGRIVDDQSMGFLHEKKTWVGV